jgi:O-antigen/teichoic acid export membrane protein
MRRLLSPEALTVLGFSGAQLVLGLAGTRLLTQVADPAALGEFYLYMNLATWFTVPAASAYLYIWKNWPIARLTGRGPMLARSMGRGLALHAAFCAVGSIALRLAHVTQGPLWLTVGALALISVGLGVNQLLDPVQMLERRRVLGGLLGLLATPVRYVALAVGVLLLHAPSGTSLLEAQCVYGLLTAAFSAWLFRRTVESPYADVERSDGQASAVNLASFSRFLRFSIPFLVTTLTVQIAASVERWGLALRATPQSTALFVQAVGLSTAATGAATLPISTYFQPIISQNAARAPDHPFRAARRPLSLFLALSFLALLSTTIAAVAFARPITEIFFGPRYRGIFELLPWAMAGQALFAMGQALSMIPILVEATAGLAVVLVISKGVYLSLLIAIPSQGDCALWFSRCFALGNLLYLAAMCLLAGKALWARRGTHRAALEPV